MAMQTESSEIIIRLKTEGDETVSINIPSPDLSGEIDSQAAVVLATAAATKISTDGATDQTVVQSTKGSNVTGEVYDMYVQRTVKTWVIDPPAE